MEIQLTEVVNVALPAIAGAIGWLAGRRKQKNDFLSELQSSVNLLSEKNKEFVEEVVRLREENLMIRGEVIKLREENKTLRAEIETLNKILSTPRPLKGEKKSPSGDLGVEGNKVGG